MSQEFSPQAQRAVQELMAIFDCKATTRQWQQACAVIDKITTDALAAVGARDEALRTRKCT